MSTIGTANRQLGRIPGMKLSEVIEQRLGECPAAGGQVTEEAIRRAAINTAAALDMPESALRRLREGVRVP
jgi:hypothetical protein